ncbi:MAG: long-chain fatty acid--CoA ligase [Myxococcota bacterium]|jgi:fatty-acyl-CoA synthase|nr:long-chain fatty acid--CoA ligase [Myxococcota bacterium]
MARLDINIGHWVRKNAQIYGDKAALKSGARSLSYRQLAERMNRLASSMRKMGLQKGDRVALYLLNGVDYVEAVFACSAMGLLAVPLNWRLGFPEMSFISKDCEPTLMLYHRCFSEKAKRLQDERPEMTLLELAEDGGASSYETFLAQGENVDAVDPTVGGDDAHLIMYTAGTTGDPKGVVLTHANCFWQSVNGWSLGAGPDTVALCILPLFHVGGLNGSVTPMIHIGATCVLPPKFDVVDTLELVERERVTGMVAVPAVYQMLYDHPRFASTDLSTCRVFLSGGAPLSYDLIRKFHERGLEFRQGYGLTETSPGATGMGPGECLNKAGTAGRPVLYVDIRIVDDAGQELPTGESGEVIIRGPNVMKGYWKRPEETAKAIRDGWFYSGDIGFLDEDGYLTLVDRKKDMIISGGENVYPAEIEKLLAGMPAVADVAVVGKSDPKWGEVPVAFVVCREGMSLQADEVVRYCDEHLARYKVPRDVRLISALPRNAAGKLIKAEIKKLL